MIFSTELFGERAREIDFVNNLIYNKYSYYWGTKNVFNLSIYCEFHI